MVVKFMDRHNIKRDMKKIATCYPLFVLRYMFFSRKAMAFARNSDIGYITFNYYISAFSM